MRLLNKVTLQVLDKNKLNSIQIMGRNQFLNELLAQCLLNDSSIQCDRLKNTEEQLSFNNASLLLVDVSNFDFFAHWNELENYCNLQSCQCHLALFNVEHGTGIEAEALNKGIRGVFYSHDPLEMISKGVQKIMQGDIWFSRESMMNCIMKYNTKKTGSKEAISTAGVNLTFREEEILRYLRQGVSNQEIADEMVVSIHTVKSHLYNIYKKIDVPNRFQAMLWATSNLQ